MRSRMNLMQTWKSILTNNLEAFKYCLTLRYMSITVEVNASHLKPKTKATFIF